MYGTVNITCEDNTYVPNKAFRKVLNIYKADVWKLSSLRLRKPILSVKKQEVSKMCHSTLSPDEVFTFLSYFASYYIQIA
jgi:hypothetical protein